IANDLDALKGEIASETGEDQARSVNGGLANDALEPAGAGNQVELERAGVRCVEPFNGDGVVGHRLEVKIRSEIDFAGFRVVDQLLGGAFVEHFTFMN